MAIGHSICHYVQKYFMIVPMHHWNSFKAWKVSIFGIFLFRNFPHSDWIRRDTKYLSVFSPNAGNNKPEKLWIRTLFTQCFTSWKHSDYKADFEKAVVGCVLGFNSLMPGHNKKLTHIYLFTCVWPICYHQALKG